MRTKGIRELRPPYLVGCSRKDGQEAGIGMFPPQFHIHIRQAQCRLGPGSGSIFNYDSKLVGFLILVYFLSIENGTVTVRALLSGQVFHPVPATGSAGLSSAISCLGEHAAVNRRVREMINNIIFFIICLLGLHFFLLEYYSRCSNITLEKIIN